MWLRRVLDWLRVPNSRPGGSSRDELREAKSLRAAHRAEVTDIVRRVRSEAADGERRITAHR